MNLYFVLYFSNFYKKISQYIGKEKFEHILNLDSQKLFGNANHGSNFDFEGYKVAFYDGIFRILNVFSFSGFFDVLTGNWRKLLVPFSNKLCLEVMLKLMIKFLKDKEKIIKNNLLTEATSVFQKMHNKIIWYKDLPNEFLKCKKDILETRDSLIEKKNMDLEEKDTNDIWIKVRIEELLINNFLKEHLPQKLNMKIRK